MTLGTGGVVVAVVVLGVSVWALSSRGSGHRVKAGRQLASATTTTTTPTTEATGAPAESGTATTDTTATGSPVIADTGGRTATGSGSSATTSPRSPTTRAPGATTVPRPATTPTTGAAAAGGCPSGHPQGQVTSFAVAGHNDGTDDYYVNVSGTVTNQASATIDLYDADLIFYGSSGQRVDSGTADLNGTLAPGQSRAWSVKGELIVSPGGPPSRATVSRVNYDWDNIDLSRCSTP
jgi:hypothetical protein